MAVGISLLPGIGATPNARAGTQTVTNLNDSGAGSLRQVIADAAAGDTITFGVIGTISLTSGQIVVSNDLTISGPGSASLRISAGRASRVLQNSARLSISGLSIRDGEAGVTNGGGILNTGTGIMTVTNSLITGNRAHEGGGIYNSAGGTLRIIDSTISSNQTSLTADSNGGGIYNAAPGGKASISGSTFYSNAIHDHGSGLYNEATATVANSTFALNQAGTAVIVGNGGDLQINNVTVTGNNGRKQANGIYILAGGATLQNSIVAGNTGGLPDCDGVISSGGHNLIGNASGCGISAGAGDLKGDNITLVNPNLGPLRDNGGPTWTQVLLTGSPAIDAGSPATPGSGGSACETADQRGVARESACDIGAVELSSTVGVLTASSSGPTLLGTATTFAASGLTAGFLYSWDFGDGQVATGAQTSHTYASAGSFTATVMATKGATTLTATTQASVATTNPKPEVIGFDPAVIPKNSANLTLTVLGANFVEGSMVYVGGSPRATTWLGSGRLSVTLLAADVATDGQLAVTVANPTPGGGASGAMSLEIAPAQAPSAQSSVFLPLLMR
jgi:hypothetical protein